MDHQQLRSAFTKSLKNLSSHNYPQFEELYREIFKVSCEKEFLSEEELRRFARDDRARQEPTREFDNKYWGEISALFWEHVVTGVISIGANRGNAEYPFFKTTEYGKKALTEETIDIFDPTGLISSLKSSCNTVDSVVEEYLSEALICLGRNCTRATLVMIGCAAEKMILDLIDSFLNYFSNDQIKNEFKRKVDNKFTISKKYKEFRSKFSQIENEVNERLGDYNWSIQLDSLFNLIRNYRNESGHPTGIKYDKSFVYSVCPLFYHLFFLCDKLSEDFKNNASNIL